MPLPGEQPRYRSRWYGWQTLIADGASLGLAFGGGMADEGAVTLVGVMSYFLAAPIVHFCHGHVGKGFLGMGLRVGMPLVVGLGFMAATNCSGSSDSYCGLAEFGIGMFVGAAGATAIDATVVARDKVPVQPSVAIVPMLGRDHAGLAIGGTF